MVKFKYIGIVASLIAIYDRRKIVDTKPSNYIANVGDKKVQINAVCTDVIFFDSQFGTQYMFLFQTKEGNVIKYITKNEFCKKGEDVTFFATIKDHCEYHNVKQTVVTRCKIID